MSWYLYSQPYTYVCNTYQSLLAGEFLARRCKDLLDTSASTFEQAAEALQEAEQDSALALSLRYSMRRKDILQCGACGGMAASKHV